MPNTVIDQRVISHSLGFERITDSESILKSCRRVILPIEILLGVQKPNEYIGSKTARVLKSYKAYGATAVLNKYPPIICEVSNNGTSSFFIVDGHHRIRLAPKFGIKSIPCLVIPSTKLAEIIRADHALLCSEYFSQAGVAMQGFASLMGIKAKMPPSYSVVFQDPLNLFDRLEPDQSQTIDMNEFEFRFVNFL